MLAITDRINCEVHSFYYNLVLCEVGRRAHFIICYNAEYLTFLFPVDFMLLLHICVLLFYDLAVFRVLLLFIFYFPVWSV